jgi:hypothetical protein
MRTITKTFQTKSTLSEIAILIQQQRMANLFGTRTCRIEFSSESVLTFVIKGGSDLHQTKFILRKKSGRQDQRIHC